MITIEQAKQNLAVNLPRLRRLRGMTQVQLASRSGVNQGTISTAEGGTVIPNSVALHNLAEALDTTSESLLREPAKEAVSA